MRLIFWSLAGLANILVAQAQIPLPEPIGDFGVSCMSSIELSDSSRTERAPSANENIRRIYFDLYYPTDDTSAQGIPYWPNKNLYLDMMDSTRMAILNQGIITSTTSLGKVSKRKDRYPLIVFSPGWQAVRFEFTTLVQHLVSLGNMVAILDHPYIGYANVDGQITTPDDKGFN